MNQEELVDFCELRFALESQALRYAVQRQKLNLTEPLSQIFIDMKTVAQRIEKTTWSKTQTFTGAFFVVLKVDFFTVNKQVSKLSSRPFATIFLRPMKQHKTLVRITKRLLNSYSTMTLRV